MTDPQPEHGFADAMVPPTLPGQLPVSQQTSAHWSKPIGIIATVLGALGILGGGGGLLTPFFMSLMSELMREVVPKGQPTGMEALEALEQWSGWLITCSLLAIVIAAMLLAAGIGMLRHRRWAVRLGIYWATVKILFVVVQAAFNVPMQKEQLAAMGQMPNTPQLSGSFASAMTILTVIIGVAWGWALPVFLLIWFSRRKVKDDIAGWA